MKSNSNNPGQSELVSLEASVMRSVEIQLRQKGNVPPIFLAATPSGWIYVPGIKVDDEAENTRYAETIRLSCIAMGASASILCVKGALVDFSPTAQLDGLSTPKPYRREGIILSKEVLLNPNQVTTFVPILRDESGQFSGFDTAVPIPSGPPHGLFGKLLPHSTPTDKQRCLARLVLSAKGLYVWPINKAASPSWN
jgi:hypothetical protein